VRLVDYTDTKGRKYRVQLPDEASDDEAASGIPVGPPDVVDALALPEPIATRLHNQLHSRGLWTYKDVAKRPGAVQGALQSALQVDVQLLAEAFKQYESEVQ
jgi:hypothetical protein